MFNYNTHVLPNGLRLIHRISQSPVSYCGFAVNAGTRDERADQHGLAHFVEHMLFKGTEKRKSWHILNRMENVGGEINAYTTKEETFLYSVCLSEDIERAVELLSDLIFHSTYPQQEIEKEREVIVDEINSYLDTPSELIYDEFENLIFNGSDLGHPILGDEQSIGAFTSETCKDFVGEHYDMGNMIFFSYGKTPMKKMIRLAEKYFAQSGTCSKHRKERDLIPANTKNGALQTVDKNLHQSHVMIGSPGYSLHDKKRLSLYLLNNILGGPGMNSKLNLSLREKHGLVYTVESSVTSYSNTGLFSVYFGCDKESQDQCIRLVLKEFKKLRETKLTSSQFSAAIKQWKGQLGIGTDHRENQALGMGKAFLHYDKYDSLEETYRKIDAVTADQLLDTANEILNPDRLFTLIFQ